MQQQNFDNFTDIKIIDSEALPELTDSLQSGLIKYIGQIWDRSVESRNDCNGFALADKVKKIEQADLLEHTEPIKNKPDYRSKVYLPWIRQAHVSVVAYMAAMLLSGKWNSFLGNTPEDKQNAEYASKWVNYLFDNNFEFRKTIIQVLYQCVQKGSTCVKGFWQLIKSYTYQYEQSTDEMGNPIFSQGKQENTIYNDVKLEYVNIDNFQFYPVDKPINEVTKVYRYYKKFSDLKNDPSGRWINLDKLEAKYENKKDIEQDPIEIKEAWISECSINADGQNHKINNIVVTIVDDVVIEYKSNIHDYGLSPFSWTVFEPIPGTNLGKGLCFDAYDLEQAAIVLFNALMDAVKMGVYPMVLGIEGRNPALFTPRPGGYIPLPETLWEKGILPQSFKYDLSNVPITFETVMMIKKEFEAATVPEFIKGIRPDKDETATRDVLVQQGSENKLTIASDNFNEEILKPILRLIYVLKRQRAQIDPETRLKLAKICVDHTKEIEVVQTDQFGQPIPMYNGGYKTEKITVEKEPEEILAEFPDILPLEKIDISVDGYKTNVKKRETIQALQALREALINVDPSVLMKFDQESAIKKFLLCTDLDYDELFFTEDEALKNEMKKAKDLMQIETLKMMLMPQMGVNTDANSQQQVNTAA